MKVFSGEDTFRSLNERLAAAPRNVTLLTQVARKYEDRFESAKAVELFKQVLALDPEGRSGTTTYGGSTVPCADYADYRIALEEGAKTEDPAPYLAFAARRPTSPLAREATRRCSYLFLSGRTKDEAFKFFEDGLAKFPGDPLLAFYYLQRILQERDNLDRGLALIREVTAYGSLNEMMIRFGAQIHVLEGDLDSADAAYGPDYIDRVLSTTVSALQGYAQFWAGQKKNMDSSIRAVQLALDLQPDNPYTAYSAANFYVRAGLAARADEVYGAAYAEKHKEDAQALVLYASFWSRQKRHPESVEAAEAAVRLKPDDPNILQTAAQAFIAWDKKDRALSVFGPAAAAKLGDNALLLNNYAWFWAQQGTNLENALAAVQKSIALDDRDYAEDTLAVVLLGLGRPGEALEAVKKAMAMSSTPSRYKETEKKITEALAKRDAKK